MDLAIPELIVHVEHILRVHILPGISLFCCKESVLLRTAESVNLDAVFPFALIEIRHGIGALPSIQKMAKGRGCWTLRPQELGKDFAVKPDGAADQPLG